MSVVSYKSRLLSTDEVEHAVFALCIVGSIFGPQLGNRVPWNKFFEVPLSSSKHMSTVQPRPLPFEAIFSVILTAS